MIGDAGCDGMLILSQVASTPRMVRMFSCRDERMDGDSRRMEMAWEAEAARRAGMAAEKQNAEALMRCHTHPQSAQFHRGRR